MRRLALALAFVCLAVSVQGQTVRVLFVPLAVKPQLDSMVRAFRQTNVENARVVTRGADTTDGGYRIIIPLHLDTADVVRREVARIDFRVPGNTDSLPTIHTHRTAPPWDVRPSLGDTLFAEHRPARYQAILTDSGHVLLYGLRP